MVFRRPPVRVCGRRKRFFPLLACFAFSALCSNLGLAQTPQQQFVYASQTVNLPPSIISGYGKNSGTGALAALAKSPFPERFEGGKLAIDGLSKFLFVLNATTDTISMFQIDSVSGTLTEVTGSPFQATATPPLLVPSTPVGIATEPSGNWVFVAYRSGEVQDQSEVAEFAIDTTSAPIPQLVFTRAVDIAAAPTGLLVDPKGLRVYIGLTTGLNGALAGGADVYSIDSASGTLNFAGTADPAAGVGQSIAMDPQGRFFFSGSGQHDGLIDACVISPVDGTAKSCAAPIGVGTGLLPESLFVESSGKFLYATTPAVQIFAINQTTGLLSSTTPTKFSFSAGTAIPDPMGPFLYYLSPDLGIHAYVIDAQSGGLTEIAGSPFNTGAPGAGGALGIAISGTPVQAASGPVMTLFPSPADFGTVSVNSSSPTQLLSIVNNGDQSLILNSIALGGANPASFHEADTCNAPAVLAPNAHCTVSLTFAPAVPGPLSATLLIADNAPGSPQSFALTGTGGALTPEVTLSPSSFTFATTSEGSSAPSQNISVTNSGTAALHVSSVSVSGANAADFSAVNDCTAAVTPSANCTIAVTFTPLGSGQRTATLTITDDAPNSPQTVALSGVGVATTTGVTVSPTTANFPPTVEGSTAAAQNISVKNNGTTTVHVSSASTAGANASDFSVANGCTAPVPPSSACAITVIFAPLGTGPRTATLSVADDAPGSPQTVTLSAIGNAPAVVGVAPNGSTSAAVSAGATATYNLQLTADPNFAGMVMFSCSGAPTAATCQTPTTVNVTNGATVPFQVMVLTSGAALTTPPSNLLRNFPRSRGLPLRTLANLWLWLLVAILALLRESAARRTASQAELQYATGRAWRCALLLLLIAPTFAGCGGGGAAPLPQVQKTVTPSGTYTLTLTPTATNTAQKQITLAPIQLTLTVN
jgi:6-phosphogluconolactonase (cycloisomerase 2 family)